MLATVLAFNFLNKRFHQSWKYMCINRPTELCRQRRRPCLAVCDHCLALQQAMYSVLKADLYVLHENRFGAVSRRVFESSVILDR